MFNDILVFALREKEGAQKAPQAPPLKVI